MIDKITWNNNADGLSYRSHAQLDAEYSDWRGDDTGTPEHWTDGDTTEYYRLYPMPNVSTTTRVFWHGIPDDLASDTASPPFRVAFHRAIAYFAGFFLLSGDPDNEDNLKRASYFYSLFKKRCARYNDVQNNPSTEPQFVIMDDH